MLPTCSRPVGDGAKRVTTVIAAADSALYQAKASGRNRTCVERTHRRYAIRLKFVQVKHVDRRGIQAADPLNEDPLVCVCSTSRSMAQVT